MAPAGFPAEYFSYSAPMTYGHNSAAGGTASRHTARSSQTSRRTTRPRARCDRLGSNNQRIPDAQEVRQKPNITAMDGLNTTFFTSDIAGDADTFPNFFGTSAAAPNAAAVAALVLQAKGGPGSVTPAQMRTMLQNSAFAHDLDPYSAARVKLSPCPTAAR